jgi:hypothetical protein
VYGATVRFSDSAALRLRRRAMVVWEEVSGTHTRARARPRRQRAGSQTQPGVACAPR